MATIASGTALGAVGLFGSLSTAADDQDEEAEPQDVEVEYVYEIVENAYGDNEHVEERLELSSGEYYLDEQEDSSNYCYIEFEAENVTDDEAITIYFEGRVNDNNTHERPEELEPGESISLSLRGINECPADPDLVEVRAWAPHVGDPHEPPEDDEDEEAEPQDVEFEYAYTVEQGDDEQLEERLELSSGEIDSCTVEADVENLNNDEGISFHRYAIVDGNPTHESVTSLGPGESDSLSMTINQGVADECPDDQDQATVHAWVSSIGESDEPPEDEEDEEEPEDEEEADGEPEDKVNLELSVSAPDSIPYEETADPSEDAADFCITVTNRGDETVSVDGQFEIGPIDEPLPLELKSGETETVHFGVMSRDLGPGDHEWTVTANGETETGTLTVTNNEQC